MTSAAHAGPLGDHERAEILDILRGFALLGIFVAHVPGLSGWDYLEPAEQLALDPGSDATLQFLREMFVRSKFYSLFSLLFGFGFAIQSASASRRGVDFASQFRRRQLGLLAIGVAHSALWHGDILLTYALLGLALIPFAGWEPRRILRWALGAFALRAVWGVFTFAIAGSLAAIGDSTVGDGAGGVDINGSVSVVMAGYYSPDWAEMLWSNIRFLRLKWLLVIYEGKLLSIGAFFLLGVALGKWRVHARLVELEPQLGRIFRIGGAVGLLGNFGLALLWARVETYPPTAMTMWTNALLAIVVPLLTIAMAAGFALLSLRGRARLLLSILAAPGRMALTTYLSQTAIGIGLFYGVGFGLRGTFSLTLGIALAFAVFALQAWLASIWLRTHRYGPVEWVWRCTTYARWLELRR